MSEVSARRAVSPASRFALRFIEAYRAGSRGKERSACRFEPSCSTYGLEAYRRYGFFLATVKTLGRLRRCRPGYEGPRLDPP